MNDLSQANISILSIFVKFTKRQTFVDNVCWYLLLCQRRPVNQSQEYENGFYLGKSRYKTRLVKSRCLEEIIIYCQDTGYHELYPLNIIRINTNFVISARLIVRFRTTQNYQIILLNNQMNTISNDQQNSRQVLSSTQ
ncbi:Hypothetical_protein [Hexamita inflata]|uniref:Hypothetical_protein n=1 Tax=Hexamita inflata TaxID=28002 RepID=A0AA86P2B5_9EUKA|nr:Hypothetical protein HINF_LOCUS16764 [Hexamita inflata]